MDMDKLRFLNAQLRKQQNIIEVLEAEKAPEYVIRNHRKSEQSLQADIDTLLKTVDI